MIFFVNLSTVVGVLIVRSFFQLNALRPFFKQDSEILNNFFLKETEFKIKSIKPYLIEEFGIDQIGYFGSFTRGDYSQASDLDVLVSFNKRIDWKFFDLKAYLESVVGMKVDPVTKRPSRTQWKETTLQQVGHL